MHLMSIVGEKGSTGKTTTVMSIAAVASAASSVLLVDTDEQGSAIWWAQRAGDPPDTTGPSKPRDGSRKTTSTALS